MKKSFFFTSILLILSAFSLAGKEIIFAQKGKSIPVIVLPGKRITPQQKTAKEELEEFFEKVLSVKVKTAAPSGTEKSFQIILSDLSQKENLIPADIKAKLEKCPSDDAFYFHLKDKSFMIAGKTPRALVYGASYFIGKYLGVTFLYPGRQGESYVKKASITMPENVEELHKPFTFFRIAAYTGHDKKDVPWKPEDMLKWQYRNLLLPLPRGGRQAKEYAFML